MTVRNQKEIEILSEGGGKLAAVLNELKKEIRPGLTTKELDKLAEKLILEAGGEPSFKGYGANGAKNPFPASLCVSINNEVVHGIPAEREFKNGDIVGLDIGMKYKNLFTDMAETVLIGEVDELGEKLVKVTKKALEIGISEIRPGARTGDIGAAIQKFVEKKGFGVVRELVGHGVGAKVHEDPEIPNWGRAGTGAALKEGMVVAIEPMVTEGSYGIFLAPDGWTWKTKDGSRAAHFEHTILVTRDGAEILTKC